MKPEENDVSEDPYLSVQLKVKKREPQPMEQVKLDEYGRYAITYPVQNWTFKSRVTIPYMRPEFNQMLIQAEQDGYGRIAESRRNARFLSKITVLVGITTAALFWRKNPMYIWGLTPLATLSVASAYFYDLGYGGMINRVNCEAFNIINQEYKKYFFSMGDVESALNKMKTD